MVLWSDSGHSMNRYIPQLEEAFTKTSQMRDIVRGWTWVTHPLREVRVRVRVRVRLRLRLRLRLRVRLRLRLRASSERALNQA